jgi:oligosaccharide reducing-end xylanase
VLLLSLLAACASLSTAPDGRPVARPTFLFQAEELATHSAVLIGAPFGGMRLRVNGDRIGGTAMFPNSGRYRFHATGASSTTERAGITVFVDDMAGGTVFFPGPRTSTVSVLVDVERAGSLPVVWQLTTDVGQSDTLLDSFWFEREGDLMTEPRPPREGAVLIGSYRNLLAARGVASATVDAKIEAAYAQLFRGGPSEAIYRTFGSNADGALAVIDEPGFQDIRSEAMALGLLLAVELDHRAEFDALWNAIHSLMKREPTSALPGSLARTLRPDGRIKDPAPSAEAEADVATALFFASGRWGDRKEPYDYATEARRLIRGMRPLFEHGTGQGRHAGGAPLSLFTAGHQPRAFVAGPGESVERDDFTSPRFYLPAFYELWARYGAREDALFWQEAVTVARDYLVHSAHPVTGLWSGLTTLDGRVVIRSTDPGSASFRRESWRTILNLAVDGAWWAADPRETDVLNRVHAFFVREGLATYGDAFTQPGRETSREHAPGLVAMNAAASSASSDPWGWRFVDELASLPFGLGRRPTSDGLLQLLGLLHVAGRFRVWVPEPPPEQAHAAPSGRHR